MLFERGQRWLLAHGAWALEIDPACGARISGFSLDGQNVLSGPEIDPGNYGSTFWTSPQSAWGWPPVAEIDSLPYAVVARESVLTCMSRVSEQLGIRVQKRFSVLTARDAACVEYTIDNPGPGARRFAPWEISRVSGGLSFFQTGEAHHVDAAIPAPQITEHAGVSWFHYERSRVTCDQKLFAHTRGAWLAHVVGDLVLIKEFDPVACDAQAPGEAAIEIFASGSRDYVELEQQGPYAIIEPGTQSVWKVNWLLRRLPPGMHGELGNPALVAWVKRELGAA